MLSPIGQHRANHITPSKGKRSKKQKKEEAKLGKDSLKDAKPPPPPDVTSFVVVGLNGITRCLEALPRKAVPDTSSFKDTSEADKARRVIHGPDLEATQPKSTPSDNTNASTGTHFSAIFAIRSSQPPILYAHLPQLVVTASLARPELPPTRLVQLPKGSDDRISEALGLPRASFIGLLEGAPNSRSLLDLIRDIVQPVEIPWIAEVKESKYLPVKINMIETTAPISKKDQA